MSIIKKGTDFGATEQVTSTKLDNLVDNASFTDTSANAVAYTGSTGTCLNGGGLEVTSAGQLQIKDSDVSTAKIADDAVTPAKTSFIDHTTGAMTLSGTAPKITFNDSDNTGVSPIISSNSPGGNLDIVAGETGSDIIISAKDLVQLRSDTTPLFATSSTSGKNETGSSVAGAQVSGGLYVTGDVYADDQVVADFLLLKGATPKITFADDDASGKLNPEVTGSSDNGNLAIITKESESDLTLQCSDNMIFETTDTPASDYDPSSNDFQTRLILAHNAGLNVSGTGIGGAKVDGGLRVTSDIYVEGDGIITNSSSPKLTFADTGNSGDQPFVQSYSDGTIQMRSDTAGSNVVLDGKNQAILQYNDTSIFRVGSDVAKNENGSDVEGAQVTGSLEVTDHLYVTNAARLGASSKLDSSPATSSNSNKIATTEYVVNKVPDMFTMIDDGGNTESSMASDTESVTLPNGLIMKFGKKSTSGDGNTTVNFATDFPNACLNVQCTHAHSFNTSQDAGLGATSLSVGSFVIRNGLGAGGNVFWFAIGF